MLTGWLDRDANAGPAASGRADGLERAIGLGRWTVVTLLYTVSPLALVMFGWTYYDTGGSPLAKFHPSTLLAVGVVALVAMRRGANPVGGFVDIIRVNANLGPFLLATAIMMAYVTTILHIPVTLFIEVYLAAAVTLALFRGLSDREAEPLALTLHAILFFNAALAFYEVATGNRLTPLVVNGEDLVEETRASALLGHPLANAMIAGAYVLSLAQGGGRDLPVVLRAICFLTALASLIPFGGRAATGATLVGLGLLGARRIVAIIRGETIDPRTVVAALIVIPLAGLAVLVAFEMGLLDTLTNRIIDDEGSASTRLGMFELFNHLDTYDLMFGPEPGKLNTWIRLHGLEYGIESFPVAFVLNYGMVPALVFFPALISYFVELSRACRPGAALVVVYYIAVALTSISLSAKSPLLSVFAILVLVLLRRGERDETLA